MFYFAKKLTGFINPSHIMEIQVLEKWGPSESEMDTMICIGHDISTRSLFYKQQVKEIITVVGAPE